VRPNDRFAVDLFGNIHLAVVPRVGTDL
jgi:hypothetical protein